jgi:tRNA-specific 2-thiouridylase
VKVRYRQADQPALLEPRADGGVLIRFDHPQRAVTPGQYAVAYDGDRCLGGGVIGSTAPAVQRGAAPPDIIACSQWRHA